MSKYRLERVDVASGEIGYGLYKEEFRFGTFVKVGSKWAFYPYLTSLDKRAVEVVSQVLAKLESVEKIEGEWLWAN